MTRTDKDQSMPPQQQAQQPGRRDAMEPQPQLERDSYRPAARLDGKVAIITGGDSGIGAAVTIAFAKEGAHCAVVYAEEHEDANRVKQRVEQLGRQCILFSGDIGSEHFCSDVVEATLGHYGHLDIVVNNAAEQHEVKDLSELTTQQWDRTFRTNIYGLFFLTRAALPHLHQGAVLLNTTSVTAYQGHPTLLDYAATKGAIVAFTRSLATNLASRGIRVNAVAPGSIWAPLVPSSFTEEHVAHFGLNTPLRRPGQPAEIAPSYVFLASDDSSYMTGQVLHPNGGRIVNG